MAMFFSYIRTIKAEPSVGIAYYHRIVGKGTGCPCFLLIYTGVKVIIAYFMPDRPETLVPVGVYKAGCIHSSLIQIKWKCN